MLIRCTVQKSTVSLQVQITDSIIVNVWWIRLGNKSGQFGLQFELGTHPAAIVLWIYELYSTGNHAVTLNDVKELKWFKNS